MNWVTEGHRREAWIYGGWNVGVDDDAPRPPEPSPMASAQARRAWRDSCLTVHPQGQTNRLYVQPELRL